MPDVGMAGLSIGELAARGGAKVQTIRYYEQVGLLPPPPRSQGNQRRYGVDDLRRLAFIRHGRELGFSIASIRELLELVDRPQLPCERADAIVAGQLGEVERRIQRLNSLKGELERMLDACGGGRAAECRILEALSGM
ncbi:MAG: helix-turn-helix domain-containing protein [Rhodospirillales bacterium]